LFQLNRLPSDSGQLTTYQLSPIDECDVDVGLSEVRLPDLDRNADPLGSANRTLDEVLSRLTECAERLLVKQNGVGGLAQSDTSALIRLQFGATAGLRLSKHVQDHRTELLLARTQLHLIKWLLPQSNVTRNWLAEQFDFLGIISGEQEALDACVAVNNQYWTDKSVTDTPPLTGKMLGSAPPAGGPGKLEIGVIEMGGASLQIAYPVLDYGNESKANVSSAVSGSTTSANDRINHPNHEEPDTSVNATKSNASLLPIETNRVDDRNVRQWKHQKVLVSSQLCFGANEFRHRLLWFLIEQSSGSAQLSHPCYSANYNSTIRTRDLLNRTCLLWPSPLAHAPLNLTDLPETYQVQGAYDSNACQSLIRSALDLKQCEARFRYCARTELPPPPETMEFRALSNFHYATRTVSPTTDTISYDELSKQTERWCSDSDRQVSRVDLRPGYSVHYCLTLHYSAIVVRELFRFTHSQFDRIHYAAPNNGSGPQIDWTQGHLLTLLMPTETSPAVTSNQSQDASSQSAFLTDNRISFAYLDFCSHTRGLNPWLILAFVASILLALIGFCVRFQHSKHYKP
jgi:hypothetical protein